MIEEGKINQIGGSKMVTLPPYMLKFLGLEKDDKVTIELKGQKLIIEKEEK
jgi:antitoxin component of MazEF toxin-antitoxin module